MGIVWENTTPGDILRIFCAGIGPLQLGVVLVLFFSMNTVGIKNIMSIMWGNTMAPGTEFPCIFCAGIGPLQLGVVLVFIDIYKRWCYKILGSDDEVTHVSSLMGPTGVFICITL